MATAQAIGAHARAHELKTIDISLHGGEPLLAGVAHMRELLISIRAEVPEEVPIRFFLQTNAMLLNERWLDLLDDFAVSVGVSLDGPARANDRHRLDHTGRSTSSSAARGIELLKTRPNRFAGILAVVDIRNDPVEVYDYLASLDPPNLDFNLPHSTHDRPPLRIRRQGVPEYGAWLAEVYDRWVGHDHRRHGIRILDDIIALSLGVEGSVESLGLAPVDIVVVESDGSIERWTR